MDLDQLTWPFSVGMLAAFNPCGFAMLPTYLGYFIGLDGDEANHTRLKAVTRGLIVGGMLTLGFVAVFGTLGIFIALFLNQGAIVEYVGYITVVVGALLIPMGIVIAMGKQISLRLPKMNKGTGSREMRSMFLFGVSYAVVSLSCTIALFVSAVSSTFDDDGFVDGVAAFVAYGVGMGAVILFLTVSLARARSNVALHMRRFLPHVGKVSGAVLVLAGFYLLNYGTWEIRILSDTSATNPVVDKFLEFQAAVSNWVNTTTTERLAVVSLLGILGILLLAWREDTTDDHAKRRSVSAVYLLTYLFVEAMNDGDFVFLPLVRFVANWPARIGHWFTDPFRFGVPLELLFVALVAWRVSARVTDYRRSHAAIPARTT